MKEGIGGTGGGKKGKIGGAVGRAVFGGGGGESDGIFGKKLMSVSRKGKSVNLRVRSSRSA